jgi:acyl-CoA thioesterase FadM
MITHMNNARYLREFDFARLDLAGRTRLLGEVMQRGSSFLASAITIRYRLPLMMFAVYKVTKKY